MITALIIYTILSIVGLTIFRLEWIHEDDIEKYFGLVGLWVFFISIAIPANILVYWIENWDCELNNINQSNKK